MPGHLITRYDIWVKKWVTDGTSNFLGLHTPLEEIHAVVLTTEIEYITFIYIY